MLGERGDGVGAESVPTIEINECSSESGNNSRLTLCGVTYAIKADARNTVFFVDAFILNPVVITH